MLEIRPALLCRGAVPTACTPTDKWYPEEVQLKIKGQRHRLWRAVDKYGVVLDILVQQRRDQHAAEAFLRRVLAAAGSAGLPLRHPDRSTRFVA